MNTQFLLEAPKKFHYKTEFNTLLSNDINLEVKPDYIGWSDVRYWISREVCRDCIEVVDKRLKYHMIWCNDCTIERTDVIDYEYN